MQKIARQIRQHRQAIFYGLALALLLGLLRWLELRLLIIRNSLEVYIGAIAIVFTSLGIWLATKLAVPKNKTIIVEKEVVREKVETVVVAKPVYLDASTPFTPNEQVLRQLSISRRELEVLNVMATGLSNQEIAGKLFVSANTIKTHSSNLFEKLDVKRRTQAVEKGRALGLIP